MRNNKYIRWSLLHRYSIPPYCKIYVYTKFHKNLAQFFSYFQLKLSSIVYLVGLIANSPYPPIELFSFLGSSVSKIIVDLYVEIVPLYLGGMNCLMPITPSFNFINRKSLLCWNLICTDIVLLLKAHEFFLKLSQFYLSLRVFLFLGKIK